MLHSSTAALILAIFAFKETLASPTHAHLHQKLYQKRNVEKVDWNALDWNGMGIDWASAYAEGQHGHSASSPPSPPPAPEAPATAMSATSSPQTSEDSPKADNHAAPHTDSKSNVSSEPKSGSRKSSSSQSGTSAALWNNLVGASNHRKVFGLSTPTRGKEVGYVSNVGIPEGSNMIKVESTDAHIFTNEFINTSQEPMTVVIWNKAASKGMSDPLNADPNLGASIAPEHAALTIPLAPGQSQVVAFQDQSVIGWAQACDTRATSGGFSTTWGEAQFNTTGSGYDVSAIQNPDGSSYRMDISSTEASSCDSTESKNMWVTDTTTVGSGSCYIAQSTAHLTTKMGGNMS